MFESVQDFKRTVTKPLKTLREEHSQHCLGSGKKDGISGLKERSGREINGDVSFTVIYTYNLKIKTFTIFFSHTLSEPNKFSAAERVDEKITEKQIVKGT